MNPDISFTVDIAGILALLSVVWGFAKMSQKMDTLSATVAEVGHEIGKIVGVLAELSERVSVLEDRGNRGRGR